MSRVLFTCVARSLSRSTASLSCADTTHYSCTASLVPCFKFPPLAFLLVRPSCSWTCRMLRAVLSGNEVSATTSGPGQALNVTQANN